MLSASWICKETTTLENRVRAQTLSFFVGKTNTLKTKFHKIDQIAKNRALGFLIIFTKERVQAITRNM